MFLKACLERHQEMATLTYLYNQAIEVFLHQNLLHADYKIDWNITRFQKKNHIITTLIHDASLAGGLINANNALALRTPDLHASNKAKLSQIIVTQTAILAKPNCNIAIFTLPQCFWNLVWRGTKRWQHQHTRAIKQLRSSYSKIHCMPTIWLEHHTILEEKSHYDHTDSLISRNDGPKSSMALRLLVDWRKEHCTSIEGTGPSYKQQGDAAVVTSPRCL